MGKLNKADVNYRAAESGSGHRCGNCQWFQPPDGCGLVAGDIDPAYVCDRFQSKATRGINWWLLEHRSPPTPKDIKAAVARAQSLPAVAGKDDHVALPFGECDQKPDAFADVDWSKAKVKIARLNDLKVPKGTTDIDRQALIWHVQHPGQSLYDQMYPNVVDTGDDKVITDGHHRAMAMWMLDQKKIPVWRAKTGDAQDS